MRMILYIAGYGRSGSTLLERLLATHPNIVGTGEQVMLASLLERPDSYCACGQRFTECSFWAPVLQYLESIAFPWREWERLRNWFERLFPGLLSPRWRSRAYRRYCELLNILIETIFERSLPQGGILIDSSKTARTVAWRPFRLAECTSFEVRVVHLVRDVRGCMWSNLRLNNRAAERGVQRGVPFASLRTVIHWPLANYMASRYEKVYPDRYVRIRYEDFVEHPQGVLRSLAEFLKTNLDAQVQLVEEMRQRPVFLPSTHQVSGNRLRFRQTFRLKGDYSWQQSLKWPSRLLAHVFTRRMMQRYGYRMSCSEIFKSRNS